MVHPFIFSLYASLLDVQTKKIKHRPLFSAVKSFNPLKPNDHYSGRTAPLTSKS